MAVRRSIQIYFFVIVIFYFKSSEFFLLIVIIILFLIMTKHKRDRKRKRSTRPHIPDDSFFEAAAKKRKMTALSFFATFLFVLIGAGAEVYEHLMMKVHVSDMRSAQAQARIPKKRWVWSVESTRFTDRMFFRLFRMTRPCFNKLCKKIEKAVGEKEFCSERYLQKLEKKGHSCLEGSMKIAREKNSGPTVSGEVKLAITLRILAGATYLDM